MFIETAQAAGTIAAAPTFAEILLKALDFLLAAVAIVSVFSFVISALLFFFALGDGRNIDRAKTAMTASIAATVIALGSMAAIHTIAGFFK